MRKGAVQLNNGSEFEWDLNISITYKFFITTINCHLLTRSGVGKVTLYIICNVLTNMISNLEMRQERIEIN
jgi:hypothetical protein